MEKLILNIITKIRQIGKYNTHMKDIVTHKADITITEDNGKLTLDHIKFDNYDELWVTDKTITFISYDTRTREVLFTYNGWDELLEL